MFKLILNYFLGIGPVRTREFKSLTLKNPNFIDQPETLTTILKREKGTAICYGEPNIFGEEQLSHHRKIGNRYRYQAKGIYSEPDRILFSLERGCIFGSIGIIYDQKSRTAIKEAAEDWFKPISKHPLFTALRLKKPVFKKGVALSLCTTGADGGFYHFLLESIPKIAFCKEIFCSLDYIIVPGDETAWKKKWLDWLNIPNEKIIWQKSTSHYQFDQLLFTSRLIKDQQISLWQLNSLNQLLARDLVEKYHLKEKIVYITRKNVKERMLEWEEDFIANNPHLIVFDAAELSVNDTIVLFQQAKKIISPHGAGLSNLIFSKPGTTVIEIYPNDKTYQPCYQRICNLLGIHHSATWVDFENKNSVSGLNYLNKIISSLVLKN